ncbi:unnamed protein product [Clonostachys byssicola]|uniref:Zn(2)-C6 fungal-type domain-containing protein n=1 Tax=Clonostachys byssicola TaxID=160290 RepID=A0A9N9UQ17_9HYPO|nr:unnamed protein product [Clonostachys byssicola]
MPIGPNDSRKKTFRCETCVSKHVKCSGTRPCTYCQKRGFNCVYPAPQKKHFNIIIDQGSRKVTTGSKSLVTRKRLIDTPRVDPQFDPNAHFLLYWDRFVQKNAFSQQGILSFDIKQMVQSSSSGIFLRQSVLALGALTATKLNPHHRLANYRLALTFYNEAVIGLRNAIECQTQSPEPQLAVLWTTMLLGLFELMVDSSGQRWVQHLVHGTSKALVAIGPQACVGSLPQRFFMEIKIFEVCRAIVFNDSSFLMQDEWIAFSKRVQSTIDPSNLHPFDDLLDIILRCASLRSRVAEFIHVKKFRSSNGGSQQEEARDIAIEGLLLRDALNVWQTESIEYMISGHQSRSPNIDDFDLLASVFQAATSIYLSGVFDYEINYWVDLGALLPTLTEDDIQAHVRCILELSQAVLERSRVSAVLLLFPLRVAGARSRSSSQREAVSTLLGRIEATFSAAGAFRGDLQRLWTNMEQDDDELGQQSD